MKKKRSKTTPPPHVIALYDYNPHDGDIQMPEEQKCLIPDISVQLTLVRGEKLKVVSEEIDWWIICRSLKSDTEGYVSTLVLAPITSDESIEEKLNGGESTNEKIKFIPSVNQNLKYFPNAPDCHAKKPCPKSTANIFSLITFWWINGLIVNGFKRPLVEEDIWTLQEEYTTNHIVTRCEKEWKKEMEAWKRSPMVEKKVKNKTPVKKEEELLIQNGEKIPAGDGKYKTVHEHKYQPSLTKTFVRVMGPYYFVGYIFKIIHDVLMFTSPYLLGKLINFVLNKNEDITWGYTYAVLLFLAVTIQSICLQQYFQRTYETGIKIRTAVMGLVYKKMLLLSNKGRQKFTAGEMVNIMSIDGQLCHDITLYAVWFWGAPVQIIVSLGFLYSIMGWSIFLGVLVLVLLVPLGVFLSKKEKKFHAKQMIQKDLRSRLINEILNGVKILKLYAWEDSFAQKILGYRNKELKELRSSKFLQAKAKITNQCAQFVVSVVIFATYVYVTGEELTAEKAFVSISIINIMKFPITFTPLLIQMYVQYGISVKRITNLLKAEELNENDVQKLEYNKQETSIQIDNGEFTWNEEISVLKDINLSIPQGSLTAIVGQVGTGKSSLISAILGEMPKIQGTVTTCGKTGYVAQQAWIQNQTLRENILFEKSYRKEKYNKIVDACAMAADLEVLPVGDMTEIGERGINLSGGQKQRVSLARAVYSNADIYLLDDPLSAVDAHVGKHIFDCVIGSNGLLKNKTRILVTHNLSFLPHVDQIIVLKNNTISERGSYKELLENGNDFAEFLKTYHKQSEGTQSNASSLVDNPTNQELVSTSLQKMGSADHLYVEVRGYKGSQRSLDLQTDEDRLMSASSYSLFYHVDGPQEEELEIQQLLHDHEEYEKKQANSAGVTYQEEKSEVGAVNYKVFLHYFQSMGIIFTMLIFLFGLMQEALLVASRFWLAEWSTHVNITDTERDRYITIYGGLGIAQSIAVLFLMYAIALGAIRASRRLHNLLLTTILKCPMSFFETTPMGRIVNRFVKDINIIDDGLPKCFHPFMETFTSLLGTIFVISYSIPIFLVMLVPISAIYIFTQRFYVASSRQLKRIESVNRSPIYNHYFESIGGASTIRAFDKNETFIIGNEIRIDKNQAAYYPEITANRWSAVRLEFCGNLVTLFAALFTIVNSETMSAGIAGLVISYSLQITQTLNWLVRMTSDLETNIIAVERLRHYIEKPKEAPSEIPEHRPDESWPEHGMVKFDMYSVRYRDDLDLVLKNIDCSIEAGEKIGIVGRTGAGKSSMMLSLFRIIESASGKISIDGVDIGSIGLKDLRSKLSIIPQDPVLFSSSFRFNLDPFDKFSDEEIWRALEVSHLKDFVSSLSGGLHYEIVESGSNLSVGQRQLVCLARALLRRSKILVLDEATAAVDMETDAYIQEAIRNEFSKCTVLTIAHRLNTIMDYDRIIVLDKGHVVELDTPKNLLSDSKSIFFGMVKESGLLNETNNSLGGGDD